MGYSTNVKSFEKVRPYLDALVASEDTVEWKVKHAARFVYALHQAMYIAQRELQRTGDSVWQQYVDLKARYTIRQLEGRVVALPKEMNTIERVRKAISLTSVPDVNNTLGVIGAVLAHKSDAVFFPDAREEQLEMPRLYAWAQKNGYNIIISSAGVTLTKEDSEDLAWKPTQESL